MDIPARVARQILLFSLLILIAPMILFPERLGLGLAKVSLLSVMYELAYYGVVIFFFNRRTSLLQMAQAAGLCLIYRLVVGAVFGVLIAAVYSMNIIASLTLGMLSYLPAILLHIAVTPFILKPAMRELFPLGIVRHLPRPDPSSAGVADRGKASMAVSVEKGFSGALPPVSHQRVVGEAKESPTDPLLTAAMTNANGFDRATSYIGEDSSVQLAAVVNQEGLLLGHYKQESVDAEAWAPFSLLFTEMNRQVLSRAGWGSPEKINILLKDKRIAIAREESFTLMVVAQRQVDDFISIRITRGLEIIRKYVAERYSQRLFANVEKIYVSST